MRNFEGKTTVSGQKGNIYVVIFFIFGKNLFLRFLKNQFFYSQSIILRNMRKKISKKM